MASTKLIRRFPRTDEPEDDAAAFVLVHVSSKRSHPLDCKLIGTENSQVYLVSLKHTKTADLLKSKNYSPQQWDQILTHVLFGTSAEEPGLVEGLETTAAANESRLTITIRKRVGDFKQKVGAIELPQNDRAQTEFDGFEWCGLALEATNSSTQQVDIWKAKVKEKEEIIQKLESSLKDLSKAKTDDEDTLLQKFAALLNEKKLKIRDQQRLLASANVDPRKLAAVEASRNPISASAGTPRAGKRKADRQVEEEEEAPDEGFEMMDVDVDQVPNDSDQERAITPDRDDDSKTDDTEGTDEDLAPAVKPAKKTNEKAASTSKAAHNLRDTSPAQVAAEDDQPPPPRALPFGRKPAPKVKPVVEEGSETESDDEL